MRNVGRKGEHFLSQRPHVTDPPRRGRPAAAAPEVVGPLVGELRREGHPEEQRQERAAADEERRRIAMLCMEGIHNLILQVPCNVR